MAKTTLSRTCEIVPLPPHESWLCPVTSFVALVFVRGLALPGCNDAASLLLFPKASPTRRLKFITDEPLIPHVTMTGTIVSNSPPATSTRAFSDASHIGRLTGALHRIGGHDNCGGTARDLANPNTESKGGASRAEGFALGHTSPNIESGYTDKYAESEPNSVGQHRVLSVQASSTPLGEVDSEMIVPSTKAQPFADAVLQTRISRIANPIYQRSRLVALCASYKLSNREW